MRVAKAACSLLLLLLVSSVCAYAQLEPLFAGAPDAPPGYADYSEARMAIEAGDVARVEEPRKVPAGIAYHGGLLYASPRGNTLELDLYVPTEASTPPPVVLTIHGGSWSKGKKEDAAGYAVELAQMGYAAASMDYRLVPDFTFPAALEDVRSAMAWLRENGGAYGVDGSRVVLMGDSAGGHLALLAGYSHNDSGAASPEVEGIINLYGVVDLTTPEAKAAYQVHDFIGKPYREAAESYEQASPIHYLDANDPPTLTFHGTIDELVPVSQADTLHEKLDDLGVPDYYDRVEGWPHSMDMAQPIFDRCFYIVERFLEKHVPIQRGKPDAARAQEISDLRFGMFVCWSLSTFSGYEWTRGVTSPEYFKATGCDTDQWCETARDAGMKYILFLTKHHDGFCLWDTDTTDFKVTNSPLGIDVLAALRSSCDKYGIKLALYFSEGDWTWIKEPLPEDGLIPGSPRWGDGLWRSGEDAKKKKAQLKELTTRYGPIEFFWMDFAQGDGGLNHTDTAAWVRRFQPDCFVGFNHGEPAGRLALRERGTAGPLGDVNASRYNKEGEKSYTGYLVAEFTYPILPEHDGGADWFYSLPNHDALCHAPEKIFADYQGAVEHGNIFSLDVGPGYDGRLREIDVATLRKVGEIIKASAPHR